MQVPVYVNIVEVFCRFDVCMGLKGEQFAGSHEWSEVIYAPRCWAVHEIECWPIIFLRSDLIYLGGVESQASELISGMGMWEYSSYFIFSPI